MGIESPRWARLQAMFDAALALPEDERGPYLDNACGDDASLRHEIDAMLAADSAEYRLGIERLVNDGAADRFIGIRLGPWRASRRIGRGGMGTVYLAERADGQYEQRVALKVVGPAGSSDAGAPMFQAERRILARLTHPNIARLLDAGFTPEGSAYMVMELVDGSPITTYCDTHRLGIDERLRLFRLVCHATQHAHQALVVHRDLKPSNIFVSVDGQVKLLDFGVAKLLEAEPGVPEGATREHRAVTLAYAAPEQLRGEPITTATDVYALGVVLYELLAGRRPFDVATASPLDVERRIRTTDPPPPSQAASWPDREGVDPTEAATARKTTAQKLAKRLRGDLDRIVLKALRREPERRYASAGQLADDIDRYLDGRPVSAQPDSVAYRARRFVARNRLGVAVSAGLVMLLAGFSVAMAVQARRIAAERDRAQVEQRKAEQVVRLLVDLFQTANPDIVPGGDRLAVGEFLDRAEARVLRELGAEPELASRMWHVLGLMHHARSENDHARDLLEAARAERRRLSGDDAPETLAIEMDLGRLLAWMGEADRARELLDDAVARIQRTLGVDHPLAASAYHALAGLSPRFEQQQQYLERALDIGRRQLPPADHDRIRYTTSLAGAYYRSGRLADAKALFEEALRSAETLNDGRTTILVSVLNDFATYDHTIGDFEGAEAKHRRALALATDLVGADSFQVANALNNLAVVLASQGRLREAADMFEETYDRHVALFGEGHWRAINTRRNVGMAMLLLDEPGECERWMTGAVEESQARRANDAGTAYMRAQLARCLIRGGRVADGIALLDPAVEALREAGPDVADYTANARLWLGTALLDTAQTDRAETLVAAAVDHYQRTRSPAHPVRAEAECELAQVLAVRGRLREALSLAEDCAPRIAAYGQVMPWRKQGAAELLQRLRAGGIRGSE